MNTKHTPGPWIADGAQIFTEEVNVAQANGYRVDSKTVAANARLIAAAPDLLEVAQNILADDLLQYMPAEYVAKVRSAIAKAMNG